MVTYPKDWTQYCINDFLKVKRGASPRPIESYITENANGVNWIKIGDAPKSGKYIVSTKEKITESGAAQSVRVYPGDFLLSNSMSFGRPYILRLEGCIHDGWLRLFDYQETADDDYLYYLLSSDSIQNQYKSFAAGSGVQNLNKEVVKKVEVCLPSLPEQKSIAETLSCMDEHIANLTELIEKKKGIRDGALEDLVNGRTRLKGFNDEWDIRCVGECAYIYSGGTPKTTNPYFWNGDVVWLTPGEITNNKGLYIHTSERKITVDGVNNSSATLLPKGTILLCTRATIGYLAIADTELATNQGFKNLVCKPDIDNVFFAYALMTKKSEMVTKAIGTTFLEISKKALSGIEMRIPLLPEQQAISSVLTAMDEEIFALEEEKEKMLQIKAGAMDDLLTGRIRLTRQGG